MVLPTLLFILVILLSGFIIVYVILFFNRKRQKVLGELKKEGLLKKSNSGNGFLDNRMYDFKYFEGSKNNPSYFSIYITPKYEKMTKGFVLRKETWFDRFFKKLGVISEIVTGDKEFDEYFFIIPKDENFTKAFLSSSKNRELLKSIYKSGFNKIALSPKKLEAKLTPVKVDVSMNKEKIEDIVQKLLQLEENINKNEVIYTDDYNYLKIGLRFALYMVSFIFVIIGLYFYFLGLIYFKPLDLMLLYKNILIYYFPSLFLYAWLSLLILKGKATSHYEWLIILGIMIFILFFFISGITMFINGKFDNSPKMKHNTIVLKKYYKHNKNSYNFYIVLKGWRNKRSKEKIEVPSCFYKRVKNGNKIEIYTKRGKLNYEWVCNYKLVR